MRVNHVSRKCTSLQRIFRRTCCQTDFLVNLAELIADDEVLAVVTFVVSLEKSMKKTLLGTAVLGAGALLLTACAGGGSGGDGGSGGAITVGTTEVVTSLDPAGAYDNGSFAVMTHVYPFLINNPVAESEVAPHIAESAEFSASDERRVGNECRSRRSP